MYTVKPGLSHEFLFWTNRISSTATDIVTMVVLFKHERLHVGFRQRDWSDVWYEPLGDEDPDGGASIGLFKLTTGGPNRREPMEGEVLWHPEFDIKNCESKNAKERAKIQKEFLTDAWNYLAEKNAAEVKRMDEELHQPDWPRWQKWFEHAQKYKRTQIKQRESRRKKRTAIAEDGGATSAEVREDVNSETSEDDSAYNTDSEQRTAKRTRSVSPNMPPPPKRRAKETNNLPRSRDASLPRQDSRGNSKRPDMSRQSTPRMSGGLSQTQGNGTPTNARRLNATEPLFRHGSDSDEDEMMDTTDPHQPQSPFGGLNPWSFAALASSNGLNGQPDGDDGERLRRHEREQTAAYADPEEAFNEALRLSQLPQDHSANEADDLNTALRRSLQPQEMKLEEQNAVDEASRQNEQPQEVSKDAAHVDPPARPYQPQVHNVNDEDEETEDDE